MVKWKSLNHVRQEGGSSFFSVMWTKTCGFTLNGKERIGPDNDKHRKSIILTSTAPASHSQQRKRSLDKLDNKIQAHRLVQKGAF